MKTLITYKREKRGRNHRYVIRVNDTVVSTVRDSLTDARSAVETVANVVKACGLDYEIIPT